MSRRYTLDTLPDCAAKRAIEAETRATLADEYAAGCEKNFQADAERWLTAHGFWPRFGKLWKSGEKPPMGWQYHLHEARGNPPLLDLLILGNEEEGGGKHTNPIRLYMEIELKTATGSVRAAQEQILATTTGTVLVRSMAELIDAVTATWTQLLEG